MMLGPFGEKSPIPLQAPRGIMNASAEHSYEHPYQDLPR